MPDTDRVLSGITPENIINPPQCTAAEFIMNNPAQAARTTFNGVVDAIGELVHHLRIWRTLSTTSQWALENVHDGIPFQIAGATRACLTRKELIQDNDGITLLGRHVVYEARKSDHISRRVLCRQLAKHPDQTAQLGLPPGCCTTQIDFGNCPCECHTIRRCTSVATATTVTDPTTLAVFAAMAAAMKPSPEAMPDEPAD